MSLSKASAQASTSVQGDATSAINAAFSARIGTTPQAFTIGTGSNGIAKAAGGILTLTANTPVTIDLTNTTATTGIVGDATFATVKLVTIENVGTANTAKPLTVGNATTNQWQGPLAANTTVTVDIGSLPLLLHTAESTGWAVNSTIKSLKLDPGASTLTLNILIAGN